MILKNIFTTLLLLAFTVVIHSSLQAQLGVRIGGHLAKQEVKSNDLNFSYKSRVGFDLGIFYAFQAAEGVAFQPELHLIQKGYNINDIVLGEDFLATFNYLEVPLTVKFTFGEEMNLFIQGGPTIGYLLNGNLRQNDIREDIDMNEFNNLEIGGLISAGVTLGNFLLDARYLLGLTDTVKDVAGGNIYNRGFGVGLSILF